MPAPLVLLSDGRSLEARLTALLASDYDLQVLPVSTAADVAAATPVLVPLALLPAGLAEDRNRRRTAPVISYGEHLGDPWAEAIALRCDEVLELALMGDDEVRRAIGRTLSRAAARPDALGRARPLLDALEGVAVWVDPTSRIVSDAAADVLPRPGQKVPVPAEASVPGQERARASVVTDRLVRSCGHG